MENLGSPGTEGYADPSGLHFRLEYALRGQLNCYTRYSPFPIQIYLLGRGGKAMCSGADCRSSVMKIPQLATLLSTLRQLIRLMVGGWSLQRKSQLFLGVALMIPIGMSFWFLSRIVTRDLVRDTVRQSARDHARSMVAWRHVTSQKFSQAVQTTVPLEAAQSAIDGSHPSRPLFEPQVYEVLRSQLVDTPYFNDQFLMLDPEVMHEDLASAKLPASDAEQQILEKLEARYRLLLSQHAAAEEAQTADPAMTVELGETANDLFGTPFTANLYAEAGPVFEEQVTPEGGWYVYYHVVQFPGKCMMCHARDPRYQTAEIPFRVVQIKIPYKQTEVVSATTLAVMIAVAMVTIAFTLLFVQWVFRNIVLNPLHHLTAVSDEISRGNIYLRASLDTGDEFSALGDSFNRMLRHMTDGQSKLRELNMELDVRVDQLAQANLQLYEANRLKSDFLANMSHELRTPLNSILGFSEVLHGIEGLNDKQRKYVSNIQTSGRVLLEMINDVLDLAKMEAGKMKVTATLFRPGDLVRTQCSALQSLLDEKNMELQLDIEPDVPEIFQDQAKIQQILTNLLSNAIKFTPDGGLITVRCGLANEDYIFLTVTDTGVGIPEDDFEIIFEKFRQSSVVLQQDGLTRQYSGTGLGLSIVKELCRLLGGQVHLTSQLGTGSTFRIVLPVRYEPMPTSALSSTGAQ